MRKLGILYFVGYLVDLLFSALATVAPVWEGVSNILSLLLTVASVAVLVLACLNKLQPRSAYLLASGYYLFMAVAVGAPWRCTRDSAGNARSSPQVVTTVSGLAVSPTVPVV